MIVEGEMETPTFPGCELVIFAAAVDRSTPRVATAEDNSQKIGHGASLAI